MDDLKKEVDLVRNSSFLAFPFQDCKDKRYFIQFIQMIQMIQIIQIIQCSLLIFFPKDDHKLTLDELHRKYGTDLERVSRA